MRQSRFKQSLMARRHFWLAALLVCGALLTACGGGGGDDSGASGGGDIGGGGSGGIDASALVYSQGRVEGLGQILVNGVYFDPSQAAVLTDDGSASTPEAVKLGMVVQVLAPQAQTNALGQLTAPAQEIRYGSEIEGPVTWVGADAMTVLGQTVRFDANTVFEEGRAATLRTGIVVEVHGLRDAQGQVQASRIDIEDDWDDPYKLVTDIAALDLAARTFTAGNAVISWAAIAAHTPALSNGQRVRVALARQPLPNGQWQATALRLYSTLAADLSGGSGGGSGGAGGSATGVKVDIEGYVTRVTGARQFVVAGVTVDASGVAYFPSTLAVGSAVEVEGILRNGVLTAYQVELERHIDRNDGFELEGRITAVNASALTFQVNGMTVYYGNSRFEDGTARQLAVGVRVEVKGALSADGNVVNATEIEFDD
ncbi:MAG: DUF5666 domain-containing protein [Burkholderiaceae bacterium]|jgi:hypothetical protein|nr:DUF5666 domain-containing protein [Burkholderiaceae bacterium]